MPILVNCLKILSVNELLTVPDWIEKSCNNAYIIRSKRKNEREVERAFAQCVECAAKGLPRGRRQKFYLNAYHYIIACRMATQMGMWALVNKLPLNVNIDGKKRTIAISTQGGSVIIKERDTYNCVLNDAVRL